MSNSNNIKAIDKEYLLKQFYNYNKKYILEDIKVNKQDNLKIDSKHLTWEEKHILGINIDNDSSSKENDYLSLKSASNGTLTWKSPVKNNEDITEENTNLATAAAIYNFEGSDNIKTIGDITKGTWNVDSVSINKDTIQTVNLKTNKEEISNETSSVVISAGASSIDVIGETKININPELNINNAKIKKVSITETNINDFVIKSEGNILNISRGIEESKIDLNDVELVTKETSITKATINEATINEATIETLKSTKATLNSATINNVVTLSKNNVNYISINNNEYTITKDTDVDVASWLE